MPHQPPLKIETDGFTTIYQHIDAIPHTTPQRTRANLAQRMRLLVTNPRDYQRKSEAGANKGWYRLGVEGCHFYIWWVPGGASPLKKGAFDAAPPGSFFIRALRHHDDHSRLTAGDFLDDYIQISWSDLPEPFTEDQLQFTRDSSNVRVLRGHPGSGKTWALWEATRKEARSAALYLTYSPQLMEQAQAHFRVHASDRRIFVTPFARFLDDLSGGGQSGDQKAGRRAFAEAIKALPPQRLGPWVHHPGSLYNELHAHLVGSALPEQIGRFPKCKEPRLSGDSFRERRERVIGREAVDAILNIVRTLERNNPNFISDCFPELFLAWKVASSLSTKRAEEVLKNLSEIDCIAIDEAQDLTPIEAFVVIRAASILRRTKQGTSKNDPRKITLLFAGDEAQTVRPTDFEWTWLNDLLNADFEPAKDFSLVANLRNPKRIGRLVEVMWKLYQSVGKNARPRGYSTAETSDAGNDRLYYCRASLGLEVEQVLRAFSHRAGTAIVSLTEELPPYVQDKDFVVLTPQQVKGLDYRSICLLNPGRQIMQIQSATEGVRRDAKLEIVKRRQEIDALRVAVSRPTERIYFLEVNASEQEAARSREVLEEADPEGVFSFSAAELLQVLESEADREENFWFYKQDALQLVDRHPRGAWTRAHAMLTLLEDAEPEFVQSKSADAYATASQVAFSLAFRGAMLEGIDLWAESISLATRAGTPSLAELMACARGARTSSAALPLGVRVKTFFETLQKSGERVPGWLELELQKSAGDWLRLLEDLKTDPDHAVQVLAVLPLAYQVFNQLNAAARLSAARVDAAKGLIGNGHFEVALEVLKPAEGETQSLEMLGLCIECQEKLHKHLLAAKLCLEASNQAHVTDAPRWAKRALDLARMNDSVGCAEIEWAAYMEIARTSYRLAFHGNGTAPSELLEESVNSLERCGDHWPHTAAAINGVATIIAGEDAQPEAIIALLRQLDLNADGIAPWFKSELKRFGPHWTTVITTSNLDLNSAKSFLACSPASMRICGMESAPQELLSALHKRTEQLLAEQRFHEAMEIINEAIAFYAR